MERTRVHSAPGLGGDESFDLLQGDGLWQRQIIRFMKANPFIYCLAKLNVNCSLIVTVDAPEHKPWAAADVTFVLFVPGYQFHIPI